MKLSIVIPVYNVAPYIERCLLSCILQDISSDDYEVIIVNDGTPDNSMAIVEPLAHKYPNIVVVATVHRCNHNLRTDRHRLRHRSAGRIPWG